MSFSQKFKLKLHKKKLHNQRRKYKCSACDKTFIQREDLKKHKVRTHNGKQPFKCQKCDVSFSKQRDLEKHIESVHIGIKLCCPLCNAYFTNNNDLIKHNVLVHEGLKQRDSGMDFYQASPPENSTNKIRVYSEQNHYNFWKLRPASRWPYSDVTSLTRTRTRDQKDKS